MRRVAAGALLATAVALALVILDATGGGSSGGARPEPAAAASEAEPVAEFGRNVVRVGGLGAADVAGAANLAAFAPPVEERPSGWVLARRDDWRSQVVAAQFAAAPVRAVVMPIERDHLPAATADLVHRLPVAGFKGAKGMDALVVGGAGRDVFGQLQDAGLDASRLAAGSPAALAATAVPFGGGFAGRFSTSVAIVASDGPRAREYALPAAAWSAFSGDTVAFVGRDGVPAATRRLLAQREKLTLRRPAIYLVGPPSAIPVAVERELARYGPVTRIAGDDPAEVAVELARFKDAGTGFGWGTDRGPATVSVMSARHPEDLPAALAYAAHGTSAPLLLTDRRGRLPATALALLRHLRRGGAVSVFALGDRARITTRTLARLDRMLARPAR